ncbi:MAG: DUF1330 domain-containing protein [Actinobacteria bacterium]|nr:DUF1330 domain-containing protein [Actinomycetota bacterium]
MTEHVTPDPARIMDAFEGAPETPVVMLNLNRYRDRAEYEPGHPFAERGLSGREAYLHYGVVAQSAIAHVGGRILWAAASRDVVIGCDHDRYDEIVAVWYPSRSAFLALPTYPGYDEAHIHREAAVEQATLLAVDGEPEPVLRNPFDV